MELWESLQLSRIQGHNNAMQEGDGIGEEPLGDHYFQKRSPLVERRGFRKWYLDLNGEAESKSKPAIEGTKYQIYGWAFNGDLTC